MIPLLRQLEEYKAIRIKNRSVVPGVWGGGTGDCKGIARGTFWGAIELFCILATVVVTQIYMCSNS